MIWHKYVKVQITSEFLCDKSINGAVSLQLWLKVQIPIQLVPQNSMAYVSKPNEDPQCDKYIKWDTVSVLVLDMIRFPLVVSVLQYASLLIRYSVSMLKGTRRKSFIRIFTHVWNPEYTAIPR